MADQLCTPEDLASALQQNLSDLNASTVTLWIECATAVVQAAAGGQRIVQVADDTVTLIGDTGEWLELPQIPVTAVTSVTLDGVLLAAGSAGSGCATYRVHGNQLWRGDGWQTYYGGRRYASNGNYWGSSSEPSQVVVVNTHGYPSGAQELQLARSAVLAIAKAAYANPSGATSEKIDDYAVAYAAAEAAMSASPFLAASLRRQYGRRAGLVRIG